MLIDVTRLVGRRLKGRLPTGVDRVALAYVQRFGLGLGVGPGMPPHGAARPGAAALLRLGRLHLTLPAPASKRVFQWLLGDARLQPLASAPWAGLLAALPQALLAAVLPRTRPAPAGRGPWLVNAGHSGLEHARWAQRLRRQGARPLLVVHDLIPITHPQFCRAGEAERHARRMRHAVTWAAAVVANSQATLDSLAGWAQAQGLPMPPATVAHLGSANPGAAVGKLPAEVATRPLAAPYFVVLGTLEPRKNHAMLLKVWQRLVQRQGAEHAPRLVVIGQRGWDIDALLRDLQRTPELQGVVFEQPHCSDADLACWLHHAQALLLPSFVEGFGMPLVEALAAGVPVLASSLPVFVEVAGSVPDYIDPLDGPGWLAAVQAYATPGSAARDAQMQRLQGFVAPSWQQHFAAVDALMQASAAA